MSKDRDVGTPQWNEKRQRWVLRVQRNGARKWFYSTTPGRRGQRECEDKALAWLAVDPTQPHADPKVAEVYDAWVTETRNTTSVKQAETYESHGRLYILPAIGNLHVSNIKNTQQLQAIINDAFKSGAKGKPLSKKSLITLRSTIVAFVKHCRKRGLTTFQPEDLTVPRRAQSGKKKILQPAELRVLFASDMTSPQYGRPRQEWFIHAYRLQVLTGLRPGELLGLKPSDIREGTIHVERSLTVRGKWSDGKNENAHRTVPVTKYAAIELAAQMTQIHDAELDTPYLFPGMNGKPAVHNTYLKHLASYCRYNGITVVTPYELRHTFVSMNRKLPLDVVKRLAGHSESMDTFGVYGHEVDGDAERTASLLDGVMDEILD